MRRSIPDDTLRRELLRLASEPGCVVCSTAHAAVDRFFAWYMIEQYHEPSIILRMQEVRGFCLEHPPVRRHRVAPSRVDGVSGSARRRC
jgi:hypothetical protein